MYKIAKPMFLIAETPVHAGSGSDLGYIDNPIQREKHTGYPKIEASSLKGALRQAFEAKIDSKSFAKFNDDDVKIHRVFGYDEDGLTKAEKETLNKALKNNKNEVQKDFAGAIGFTDARILLFPVKSLKGTFAYITCPRVLAKFKNELNEICEISDIIPDISLENDKSIVPSTSNLFIKDNNIQLEEYIYTVDKGINEPTPIDRLVKWFSSNVFANSLTVADISKNLVIVPNDDFADFVKFGTEVSTRIKIDNETGTVKDGALFTVEYLPAEAVMYSLAMFSPEFRKNGMNVEEVEEFFNHKPQYFQLGGDATTGKGILNLQVPTLPIKKEAKS